MKRIQCLKDFNNFVGEIPNEFLNYLNCEFYSLYEYLSDGEGIEEFLLDNHQAMIFQLEDIQLHYFLRE
ncbi:hypothetical protein CHI02_07270 [Niallia circulans]|uniref:hypothetical protein n=1 Tax=Niallia circulans TaxID=1397 RepID=UPI000BA78264|nr:hypothetical protein [Niallia circulans]PAE12674.1 hypothetical protein CHI02_07270 [Niallia circulans]